jgi:hypothetical protein
MKRALFFLVVLLACTACRRPVPKADPNASGAFPEDKPVIDAAPVDTKSYNTGYELGYAAGTNDSRPGTKVPPPDKALALAVDAAGDEPARNKKWRDGWANGYMEGFRNRALNIK